MSSASRGADFERRVRDILLAAGWYVTRAAGSHGPADLVAIAPSEVCFVNVKLGGPGRIPPAEWNALYRLTLGFGGTPLVAHRPARGRVVFERILAEKEGRRGTRPPCEPWLPEQLPERWQNG